MATTTLFPIADGTIDADWSTTESFYYEAVDEGIASTDDNNTKVSNDNDGSAGFFMTLSALPGDVLTITGIQVQMRLRDQSTASADADIDVVRIYQSDESTALSSAGSDSSLPSSWDTVSFNLSVSDGNPANWSGAKIYVEADLDSGKGDDPDIDISTIDVIVTYTASGGGGTNIIPKVMNGQAF